MKSASPTIFDEAYYQRFYFDKKTSVVDLEHMERLGNFVCSYQGVEFSPYLSRADLKAALLNLGRLSKGALYVEAVSREDYEHDTIDEDLTDSRVFRHRADLYRRGLCEGFVELGGGVWLSHHAEVPTFALERTGGPG